MAEKKQVNTPFLFTVRLMHAALQAVSEDTGILKVRGHAAAVPLQLCYTPPGLLQLGLQCSHLHTQSGIIFIIFHYCCCACQCVLSHLGIELLSCLPLCLQFFLRLLESSADKFHLCLAALQLHGQLTVCGGKEGCDFVRGDGHSHTISDVFVWPDINCL